MYYFSTLFQFLEASSPVIIVIKEMSQYVHKLFFLIINCHNFIILRHSTANLKSIGTKNMYIYFDMDRTCEFVQTISGILW